MVSLSCVGKCHLANFHGFMLCRFRERVPCPGGGVAMARVCVCPVWPEAILNLLIPYGWKSLISI